MEHLSDVDSSQRDVLRRSKSLRPDNFEDGLHERDGNIPGGLAKGCTSPTESSHGAVNTHDDRDLSTPVWVPRLV